MDEDNSARIVVQPLIVAETSEKDVEKGEDVGAKERGHMETKEPTAKVSNKHHAIVQFICHVLIVDKIEQSTK